MSAFTKCMTSERPENTLFEGVNGWHVGFAEMQHYLPMILALFEISPTCVFGFMYVTFGPRRSLFLVYYRQPSMLKLICQLRGVVTYQFANSFWIH